MIILMSKYRSPFTEPPKAGVHYISLDDQADMALGKYDAHVKLYYSLIDSKPKQIEFTNSLTGETFLQPVEKIPLIPFSKTPFKYIDPVEKQFLLSLKYDFGVKAARKLLQDPNQDTKLSNVFNYDFYKKPETKKAEKKKYKGRKQKLLEKLLSMADTTIE